MLLDNKNSGYVGNELKKRSFEGSNMKLGFLANFGYYPKVEIERIVK